MLLRFLNRGSTKVLKRGGNAIIFVLWEAFPGLEEDKTVGGAVRGASVAETVMARTRKGAARQDGGREGEEQGVVRPDLPSLFILLFSVTCKLMR